MIQKRKVKKYKTKKSFWASYCALEFEDKKLEKLYNNLLEIEDKISEVRKKLLEEFTKYKDASKLNFKFIKKNQNGKLFKLRNH